MKTLWIAPLSTPAATTAAVYEALASGKQLFVQTALHPAAKAVLPDGAPFTAMDDLYERAEDFDALNEAIADRLLAALEKADADACVYAVTGNIRGTQLTAIRRKADEQGIRVEVLPGVPVCAAAFPARDAAISYPASALPAELDPSMPLCIEEIDTQLMAGEVKLLLSEYYPDEWEILLADMDERGMYRARAVPLYELDRQAAYTAATAAYVPAAGFDELTRYGYRDVYHVMKRLRAPDGCPWDREQTHDSLKTALLEESSELLDAIDEKDDAHIVEELGDVLMQVVFHEQIGAEQGRFTDRDVATGLVTKLVYRHPHVFGTVKAETSGEVLKNWETLKMAEKGQRTQTERLQSVPRSFPALTRARKVQKRAADVGFDWHNAGEAFPKIAEETDEVYRALQGDGDVSEEMGDLLFAVVNVARLLKLEPELLLMQATDKFIRRFDLVEREAMRAGKPLDACTFEEMDAMWEHVKISLKSSKKSE